MGTLWTFGDSFTAGDGCLPDLIIRDGGDRYYKEYSNSENDIWPNILGKSMGYEVKNLGKSGASNDYILDSIIDNFEEISESDAVIIGKTFYERFDVPKLNSNEFHTQYGESLYTMNIDLKNNKYNKDRLEIETILNYGVLFASNNLFRERQNKRFHFIENQLRKKVNKILVWESQDFTKSAVETITDHTGGKISDYHFSFNGHKEISDIFYKKINKKMSII
jgi:hypothetical protein